MKDKEKWEEWGDTHLEVVPERPIAKHLEKSMVVRVFSHILEVWDEVSVGIFWLLKGKTVVFSASPDALLAVKSTLELGTL